MKLLPFLNSLHEILLKLKTFDLIKENGTCLSQETTVLCVDHFSAKKEAHSLKSLIFFSEMSLFATVFPFLDC